MSALVKEEPMGNGYAKVSFDIFVLFVLQEEHGFFNPELLTEWAGKTMRDYTSDPRCMTDFMDVLEGQAYNRVRPKSQQHSLIEGWYLHPTMLLDLAQWSSVEAFAVSAIVVDEIFHRDEGRKSKLSNLMKCDKVPYYEQVETDPSKWRIRYSNLTFIVDERGWFDAQQFCAAYNQNLKPNNDHKTLIDFEGSPDWQNYTDYLRKRSLFADYDSFYHPLLFLRLARWLDKRHFVKCVRIVFCGDDKHLDTLFRKTIAAAGLPPGKFQSEGYQPSTSTGQPSSAVRDFDTFCSHNGQDVDMEPKNNQMDDCMISLKEDEQKVAHLQQKEDELQQKEDELQRKETELQQKEAELPQKEAELQRREAELQQKEAELQQEETRLQKEQVELQQKIAELKQNVTELQRQLQNERSKKDNIRTYLNK